MSVELVVEGEYMTLVLSVSFDNNDEFGQKIPTENMFCFMRVRFFEPQKD